jgi:uncharacterized protein
MHDNAVLIFAKTPWVGRVKTRLIPVLGERKATELYIGLLQRELRWIADETPYAIELWVTPDDDHPVFADLARRYRLPLLLQAGADLGERMSHAVRQALTRYRRVVLLGVDCPALTADHLHRTFAWLAGGTDAVLGPAEDGGYVLMGLGRWHERLFTGHAWGGSDVAETTRQSFVETGLNWRELAPLWDLDRPDDLAKLARLMRSPSGDPMAEVLRQALPRELDVLVGLDCPERP